MMPGETILTGAPTTGVSEFKVMKTCAWYIGTTFLEDGSAYSRETDYFSTEAEAQRALNIYKTTGVLLRQR